MFETLPPLSYLRTFEAAGRLQSFTAAAQELGITQGAVSQQIKALEAHLGRPLFSRSPRGASLNGEGRQILESVRESLDLLAGAVGRQDPSRRLMVSALPGFTVKWLFPRLIKFDQQHPDIEVSISTTGRPVDVGGGEADCAIRYGRGNYPGLVVERILTDDMFPVCSPALVRGRWALRRAADLCRHVMLHDEIKAIDGVQPGWQSWVRQTETTMPKVSNHRQFGQSNMVIQAAIEGMGVALGRQSLVIDDLISGLLVRPFGRAVPSGYSYFLVYPHKSAQRSKVAAFHDWLHTEARLTPALPDPLH